MNRVLTRILTQTSIRHIHTEIVNPDFFQRALQRFPKQCDLAFAYGSGVFQQDGNVSKSNMTDFIIVVNNSEEWHAENLELNPKDYSGVMSMLGPKIISEVQDKFGAKCYFNTLIPFEDGLIKYGVINRSHIIADLLDWESLYIGGRLQKPVRMIQDCSKYKDPELHMALRMNLKNALHTSFLLLPEKFSDKMLYNTLCGLSYKGDFRMAVGEDKNKVKKIAEGSYNELKQLYARELSKISEFVYIPKTSENLVFEQDMSPGARHFHLTMLPKNMQELLVRIWNQDGKWRDVEDVLRSAAYDRDINELIEKCLYYVVSSPALLQAAKGVLTAGMSKTVKYSSAKVTKMLKSHELKRL